MAIPKTQGNRFLTNEPSDDRRVQISRLDLSPVRISDDLSVYETSTGRMYKYIGPSRPRQNIPGYWKEMAFADALAGYAQILQDLRQGLAPSADIGLSTDEIPFNVATGDALGVLFTRLSKPVEWEIVDDEGNFDLIDPNLNTGFPYSFPADLSEDVTNDDTAKRLRTLNNLPEDSYVVKVRARTQGQPWSDVYSFLLQKGIAPPEAPENIDIIEVGQTTIDIGWFDVSDRENGYVVEQVDGPSRTLPKDAESFRAAGLMPNSSYTFSVHAFNKGGPSPSISITSKTAPQNTTLTPSNITNNSVRLEAGFRGNNLKYYMEQREPGGTWQLIYASNAGTVHTARDLAAGTLYEFRVRVGNEAGISGYSNPIEVTTLV